MKKAPYLLCRWEPSYTLSTCDWYATYRPQKLGDIEPPSRAPTPIGALLFLKPYHSADTTNTKNAQAPDTLCDSCPAALASHNDPDVQTSYATTHSRSTDHHSSKDEDYYPTLPPTGNAGGQGGTGISVILSC